MSNQKIQNLETQDNAVLKLDPKVRESLARLGARLKQHEKVMAYYAKRKGPFGIRTSV